jgi:hypothetical protein
MFLFTFYKENENRPVRRTLNTANLLTESLIPVTGKKQQLIALKSSRFNHIVYICTHMLNEA